MSSSKVSPFAAEFSVVYIEAVFGLLHWSGLQRFACSTVGELSLRRGGHLQRPTLGRTGGGNSFGSDSSKRPVNPNLHWFGLVATVHHPRHQIWVAHKDQASLLLHHIEVRC